MCAVTNELTKSTNDKVGATAFEFWTELAEKETEITENSIKLSLFSLQVLGETYFKSDLMKNLNRKQLIADPPKEDKGKKN